MERDFYRLMIYHGRRIKKHYDVIEHNALIHNLNVNLLFGFIVLEQVNRGNIMQKIIENLMVYLTPKIVVKKDMSLGLAQIKISTAQKIYSDEIDRVLAKKLLDNEFNISTCAKLLESFISDLGIANMNLLALTKKYLTGNFYSNSNDVINLYHKLLHWSVKQKLFDKCKSYGNSIGGGNNDNVR